MLGKEFSAFKLGSCQDRGVGTSRYKKHRSGVSLSKVERLHLLVAVSQLVRTLQPLKIMPANLA